MNEEIITQENSFELSEEEQAILDQAVEEAIFDQAVGEAHQEIPTNSQTLLIEETTSRFSSAIWYENIRNKRVILAGVGGIGSHVGFLLSRLKPDTMYIFDDDIVEAANMSGQLYSMNDIGSHKVQAMFDMIKQYSDYHQLCAIPSKFIKGTGGSDIMICGFDTMEARRTFYNEWKEYVNIKEEKADCLFIDGRLAAEEFQIFCIKGDDTFNMNRYETEFLFSDLDADETICSYKQTTFCASMIASYIVNLFVNFCANQCNPLINRDLPFFTAYNAETMYLKTEA